MQTSKTDTKLQKEQISEIQMEHDEELCSEPCLTKCQAFFSWFKIHVGTYMDNCLLEYYKHSLKYL